MIFLKKVSNKKDLRNFVIFPFELYKGSKYWIPPIINQEMNNFNKDLNPNLQDSKVELFLAYQDKKVVGRIAVIINWFEVKKQKTSKIRFGWFDFIDNYEVSDILFKKVIEIGKANHLEYMEGPMGCLLYTSPSPRD